jgi:hypothetical protein
VYDLARLESQVAYLKRCADDRRERRAEQQRRLRRAGASLAGYANVAPTTRLAAPWHPTVRTATAAAPAAALVPRVTSDLCYFTERCFC